MSFFRLDAALKRYKDSLEILKETINTLNTHTQKVTKGQESLETLLLEKEFQLSQQVLTTLAARDEVQAALKESINTSGETLTTLIQLDKDFKQNLINLIQKDLNQKKQLQLGTYQQSVTPVVQLEEWRKSINPSQEAWWWFLQAPEPLSQWNRFDWLWSALSVTFLTFSVGLVGDITPRFLIGTTDLIGTLAISTQSILTLLTGGSIFTKQGRQATEKILSSFLNKRFWHEAGAVSSMLLLMLLGGFRLSLPQMAVWYNHSGFKNYSNGQWSSAKSDYERALQLNPDYAEAHFNLGLLYEDLQKLDKARTQYQIALEGGFTIAYNNLARIHIIDKNYSAAAFLLLEALNPANKLQLDIELKKKINKNLGWTRFKQQRYAEAEYYLNQAIKLNNSNPDSDWAAPHCLLAQALEAQDERKKALVEWEICVATASVYDSDEDNWSAIGSKRLLGVEEKP